jgi:hypothetical protein
MSNQRCGKVTGAPATGILSQSRSRLWPTLVFRVFVTVLGVLAQK